MRAEDRAENEDKRSRRKRKTKAVARVVSLIAACVLLPIFLTAIAVGYLSWIGILVGIIFLAPGIVSPVAGFAGKKRLEGFLGWLSAGMPILLTLTVSLATVWPLGDGKQWKPYRFDAEFDALEAERAVPDEENAAIRCAPLFARLDANDQPTLFVDNDVLYEDAWTRAEYPEASRQLDDYAWAVDELALAAVRGPFRWPLQRYAYDEFTVPYKPLRCAFQLLTMSANRDLGEGQFEQTVTRYFCALEIAHDLRRQVQPLDFRIGHGYETRALRLIRRALVQHALSNRDIARIAERLPKTDDDWPAEATALFRAEKLRYMNLLARVYEVNPEGEVRFSSQLPLSPDDPPQDIRWLRPYWPMNMPLEPKGLHDIAEDYFSSLHYLLEPNRLPPDDRESGASWTEFCRAMGNFYRWFAETAFYRPDEYAELRRFHSSLLAERRGTWLVLALRRYRDEHNTWPSSLDEISKHVPPEAFVDPANGGAFVYAPVDDSFSLYSTGLNRITDAESSPPETFHDDVLIWPLRPPRSRRPKSKEALMEELKAIYGEDYITRLQADANAP